MAAVFKAILIVVIGVLLAPDAAADPSLAVVVHPNRSGTLTVSDVGQIFLKKRRYWPDGRPIIPINREAESNNRAKFSRAVFGGRAERMAYYWKRLYFQGVLPPPTLASSAAVKRFVATEPNAIGYIEASEVDDSVRVVVTLE